MAEKEGPTPRQWDLAFQTMPQLSGDKQEVLQVLTCIQHLLEVKFSEVQRFRDFKVVSLTTSSTSETKYADQGAIFSGPISAGWALVPISRGPFSQRRNAAAQSPSAVECSHPFRANSGIAASLKTRGFPPGRAPCKGPSATCRGAQPPYQYREHGRPS